MKEGRRERGKGVGHEERGKVNEKRREEEMENKKEEKGGKIMRRLEENKKEQGEGRERGRMT